MVKYFSALVLAGALALGGCSTNDVPAVGDPAVQADAKVDSFLSDLGRFTVTDLEVAMKLTGDLNLDGAVDDGTAGDPIALQCYSYLRGKVANAGGGNSIQVAGVVSAFQSARNVRRRVDLGASDEFVLNCGPLITDVRMNALGVISRIGSGGILPF